MKMGYNTRTAPRLQWLVFQWARGDVLYFIHLEKFILFQLDGMIADIESWNGWSWKRHLEVRLPYPPCSSRTPGDVWFHHLFASILTLSLAKNSLFIHAGLLAFFVSLCIWWHGTLFNLDEVILQNKPDFWGPLSIQGLISCHSFEQISEDAGICSHNNHDCELDFPPPFCSQVPELQPRPPLTFRCPTSPSLFVLMRSSRTHLLRFLHGERCSHQCNPGTSWIAYACCVVLPGNNFSIYIFSKLGLSDCQFWGYFPARQNLSVGELSEWESWPLQKFLVSVL